MCLYPRIMKNPKYKPNKKNGGDFPDIKDFRVKFVPVACGQCMECRKQKANEWRVRLHEEIKVAKYMYFVTLTYSNEELDKLCKEAGLKECNAIAGLSIRRFLERVRKQTGKSIKHWLITELGQDHTERIHLHGLLFTEYPITNDWLSKMWKYGICDTGKYVNSRTINYIVKYVTKIDEKHKTFVPQIFCSKGIGSNYISTLAKQKHKYKGDNTRDYYTLPNGQKVQLPIYYRNKLFTEEERELLWLHKLDKDKRYVNGIEIKQFENNKEFYFQVLQEARRINQFLGYGNLSEAWKKEDYNVTLKMLSKNK